MQNWQLPVEVMNKHWGYYNAFQKMCGVRKWNFHRAVCTTSPFVCSKRWCPFVKRNIQDPNKVDKITFQQAKLVNKTPALNYQLTFLTAIIGLRFGGMQTLVCSCAVLEPSCITSLQEEWIKVDPAPEGIIDRLVSESASVHFLAECITNQIITSSNVAAQCV